jgi:hypothetical protein
MEQELTDAVFSLLKSLGLPGGVIAVVAYAIRKIVHWAIPHAESCIQAYLKRQETMEECQRNLTESTIDIQRKNQVLLQTLHDKLPGICQKPQLPGSSH